MKKTLLVAAFALAGSFAFAQKPSAGSKTAEVNLNFQTGTAPVNYNLPAELRLRYFLADNAAVRIRLGLGSSTTKTSVTNTANTSEITDKTGLGLSITPGYEMHFEGTSKLSPYVGAQLGITLGGKASREVTNASVSNPNPGSIVVGDSYKSTAGSMLMLNLGLMMGADYYIADGVFIGGEFGLGLFGMANTGEGETITKVGSVSTTAKTTKASTTDLFGVTTGGVRLGFVF
ncbi:MAG: outer membrane beta-barrel protein [bacterium]|nr:outer membrane beta-barrel protein [bacterium]